MVVAGYVALTLAPGWDVPGFGDDAPTQWATVATDVLNVREEPNTGAAILDSYRHGESVEVIGEVEAGFVPIRYGDDRAWMAQEYLAFDGSTLAVTSNPLLVADVVAAEMVSEPVAAGEDEAADVGDQGAVQEPVEEPGVAATPGERWIDVNRSTAEVTLYDGTTPVATFTGRIGRDLAADGYYSTAIGTFHVYSMNKGLASTPFADDTYLTDWVGFDPDRKNGIHSPVRDEFGNEKSWQNPSTLGCVRLDAAAAVTVFEFAEIGMRVEVHD